MPVGEVDVRRRGAAAHRAVVHHIVVQQRGRLEELHRRRRPHRRVVVRATQAPIAPVAECGAQTFAAGQQRRDDIEERRALLAELGEDVALVRQLRLDLRLDATTQGVQVAWCGH